MSQNGFGQKIQTRNTTGSKAGLIAKFRLDSTEVFGYQQVPSHLPIVLTYLSTKCFTSFGFLVERCNVKVVKGYNRDMGNDYSMTKKEQVIQRIATILEIGVNKAIGLGREGVACAFCVEKSHVTLDDIMKLLRSELHDIPDDWMEHEW